MSHPRLLLLLMGGAAILGSVAGACFGLVRAAAGALHDGGDDQ